MDRYEELQRPLFDLVGEPKRNSLLANIFVGLVRRGYRDVEDIASRAYLDIQYRMSGWNGGQEWQRKIVDACNEDKDGGRAAMESMAVWALEWEQLDSWEKEEIRSERAQPFIEQHLAKKREQRGQEKAIPSWEAARAYLPERRAMNIWDVLDRRDR